MDTGFDGEQRAAPKVFDSDTLARLKSHGPLNRLTRTHQRSLHLTHEQATELVPSPGDVDYSLKGLPDNLPHVQWLGLEADPSRFRIEGLVPRGETRRAKMKQDFLLSHGLPTERFLEIYDLPEVSDTAEYIPVTAERGGNLSRRESAQRFQRVEKPPIPIDEWKQRVLEQLEYRRTHSDDQYFERYRGELLVAWKDISSDDIDRVADYIRRTDYVVVLREQPVESSFIDIQETASQDSRFSAFSTGRGVEVVVNNEPVKYATIGSFRRHIPDLVKKFKSDPFYDDVTVAEATNAYRSMIPRLRELKKDVGRNGFYSTHSTYFTERMLDRAFQYINNSDRYGHSPLLPEGGLHVENTDHIKYFFQQFIPVNMADYLAELHSYDISHGYAHGQNWKLGIFLMDLDSMKGAPFGDEQPTDEAKRDDVQRSIGAIDTLFSMEKLGGFPPNMGESYLSNKFLQSGYDGNELNKIYAMRKEAVCQFLARYLQRQGGPITRDSIAAFLEPFNIKESTGSENDYYADPPITKLDYGDRIFEIAEDRKKD